MSARNPLRPGLPAASSAAYAMAARILTVPRFERGASHKGWASNGIFYRRDSGEAMARLSRVIELKTKISSVHLRLSHDDVGGKKGLRIWWQAKNSSGLGQPNRKRKHRTPEEEEAITQKKRDANREGARIRKRDLRARGMCPQCGKQPARPSGKMCERCAERARFYRQKVRNRDARAKIRGDGA